MLTLILAAGLVCTTTGNTTVCEETNNINLAQEQLTMVSFQRICVNKIPALERSKYPGGVTQLFKDCEEQAKTQMRLLREKATRSVDQNGLQR